ncbi:nucleoside-diphosphate kinase [Candidatus Pacearchaeota archaeon]|nr:nucleoside-diphosphate kinase [Candidatus Pacearchaeota archaeon]
MMQRTLVLIKPDGVQRALIGKIIQRFEDVGLKIIGMKMIWIDQNFAEKHYPLNEEWAKAAYEKTKTSYEKSGKELKYTNYLDLGKDVQLKNMKFLCESPVLAMVLEGIHSIELVRKIIGSTEPKQALPGTIRGDFSHISYLRSDEKGTAVRNLLHASSDADVAEKEIGLWFKPKELHSYKNVHDFHVL